MSVMIETSLGEVVMDLFCDEAPLAAKNFLKLCKIKYYNGCLFYNVQQNFMIQTGDPTATGKGGTSVYGLMYGEQARFFEDEVGSAGRKHDEAGLVSMANMGVPNSNSSQFFFSMRGDDMQHLDGKHTVFAKVMEGMETLEEINSQFCDDSGRPYRDIRILHTYVLDDPFDDPPQLVVPDESPLRDRPEEERVPLRLGALDEVSLEADEKTELEREKKLREKTARSNAVVLEMIGDLPDADMKPPENVLFVCKLNPVTTDDDLEIIFTRFGSCRAEICRDHVTGDSLNYAFVEFEAIESCEEAYKKMNNVLIDDRRIRVDFSQSVAKEWSKYKGRAQGGQKLASGKGGRPTQPSASGAQRQAPEASNENGTGGHNRRSKWGNAPATAIATPSTLPRANEVRRGGSSREEERGDDWKRSRRENEGRDNIEGRSGKNGPESADRRRRRGNERSVEGDRYSERDHRDRGQDGVERTERYRRRSDGHRESRQGGRRAREDGRDGGKSSGGGSGGGGGGSGGSGAGRRDDNQFSRGGGRDEDERRDGEKRHGRESRRTTDDHDRGSGNRGNGSAVDRSEGDGRREGRDRESERRGGREERSGGRRRRSRSRSRSRERACGRDRSWDRHGRR